MTPINYGGAVKKEYYESGSFQLGCSSSPRVELIRKTVENIAGGGVLLDIGCGDGRVTDLFRDKFNYLYGIDISGRFINEAKKKGIMAQVVDININPLPYPDSSFDVILCSEVIEHIFDTDFLLQECNRVLKNKGHLVLSTPNLAAWYNRILLICGFQPIQSEIRLKGGTGHIRAFTLKALKSLLMEHNFQIKDLFGVPTLTNKKILKLLETFFSHFPSLSSGFVCLARKGSEKYFLKI